MTKYNGRSKNPLDWGLKQEESARKAYYRLESSKHNQLDLISKGLMISKQSLLNYNSLTLGCTLTMLSGLAPRKGFVFEIIRPVEIKLS